MGDYCVLIRSKHYPIVTDKLVGTYMTLSEASDAAVEAIEDNPGSEVLIYKVM